MTPRTTSQPSPHGRSPPGAPGPGPAGDARGSPGCRGGAAGMRPDRSLPLLPNAPLLRDQICGDPGVGGRSNQAAPARGFCPNPFFGGQVEVSLREFALTGYKPFPPPPQSASFPLRPQRAGAMLTPLAPPLRRCLSAPSILPPGFSPQKNASALSLQRLPRVPAPPAPGREIPERLPEPRDESYVRRVGFGKGMTS